MTSVIDRLRVAHHLALKTHHSSELDSAALVRAWPRLARSAAAAQQRIGWAGKDMILDRIALGAESLGGNIERQPWPGRGRPDAALTHVAIAIETATAAASDGQIAPADVAESGQLIASILWTTSQMIGRAARDHAFDIRIDHKNPDRAQLEIMSIAKDTYRRFNANEQLAAQALWPLRNLDAAATGSETRLRQAVATWDVEAHRALLGNPSTAVLHVLAHLEAETVKAAEILIHRSTETNFIDTVTADRLTPILNSSSRSWAHLRDVTSDLAFGAAPVPLAFINAGRNLQEAFTEATQAASPETKAGFVHALSGHLASAVTVAATARDLIKAGELHAPALAIARLLIERHPGEHSSPKKSAVDPVAIHRRLAVPLTAAARQIIDEPARQAFLDADEAVHRAAGLDVLYRNPRPNQQATEAANRKVSPPQPPPAMTAPNKPGNLTP